MSTEDTIRDMTARELRTYYDQVASLSTICREHGITGMVAEYARILRACEREMRTRQRPYPFHATRLRSAYQ